MQIFLEPMTIYEVSDALNYKLIDGVNLCSDLGDHDQSSFDETIIKIAKMINGPVFVSITGSTADEMLESARKTLKLGPNVVLKVKANLEGLKTLKTLSEQNINANMTSIENPVQAAMAVRANAKFVTISNKKTNTAECGRFELIKSTSQIFQTVDNKQHKTQIVVSGFESGLTGNNKVTEAIMAGADAISVSYDLLIRLAQNQ
ncbi:MAG: hypothetical protein BA863_13760 [Desulfovibrio sp. S3730MH75]|nr:MAG: hypothetical protein BA863_13760 [Desulfovibrio sp. S3730MH75]